MLSSPTFFVHNNFFFRYTSLWPLSNVSKLVQKMKLKFRWNTHKEKLFNVRRVRDLLMYIHSPTFTLRVHIEIILRDAAICNCNYPKDLRTLRCLNEWERKSSMNGQKTCKVHRKIFYGHCHELVEVISEKNNGNFSLNLSPRVIIMTEFSRVSEIMACGHCRVT